MKKTAHLAKKAFMLTMPVILNGILVLTYFLVNFLGRILAVCKTC